MLDLSIIIPAYNEETNIRLGSLDKVSRYLERFPSAWEVIIVDDGSRDATGILLDEFVRVNQGFRVVHNAHVGKAGTVAAGVSQARGNIILFTDLDQATPIGEIEKVMPWFAKGFDIVIGSRDSHRPGAPLFRIMMARGFMMMRSLMLGLKGITDTQCGFKAFRKEAAKEIFANLRLYGTNHEVAGSKVTAGFDIEVLFIARKRGYRVKEVPVEWHYVETRRVNPVKDSWQGFLDILRIRANAMKGYYN